MARRPCPRYAERALGQRARLPTAGLARTAASRFVDEGAGSAARLGWAWLGAGATSRVSPDGSRKSKGTEDDRCERQRAAPAKPLAKSSPASANPRRKARRYLSLAKRGGKSPVMALSTACRSNSSSWGCSANASRVCWAAAMCAAQAAQAARCRLRSRRCAAGKVPPSAMSMASSGCKQGFIETPPQSR